MLDTPVSLLLRIRQSPTDDDWEQLVTLYSPVLFSYASRLGLRETDAADLVQEVLMLLLRKLPEFEYDESKSFRGWLRTIATNKLRERLRRRDEQPKARLSGLQLVAQDETAFWERDFQKLLMQQALHVMQAHFEENTWRACWEHTIGGRTAADIGKQLGMSEAAVYVAKSRVLRRLRQEFEGLLD